MRKEEVSSNDFCAPCSDCVKSWSYSIVANLKVIKNRLKENLAYRKKTQPAGIYNAGSVFKNTENYSAGELIDKSGLKGYSVNGVKVSNKHANFLSLIHI